MTTATTTMAVLALLGGCAAPYLEGDAQAAAGPECRLEHRGGTYRAVVEAAAPVEGDWRLRLGGAGLAVAQSGAFEAAAGERLVLSEAAVGRTVPDAALTLQVDGRTWACPLAR